jgi:NAD(P)-dependent dehydrogenase (short-subunit alcohol dehydrogenase family)
MNIRFDNKRILITGAGRGIGRQIATLLAESGGKIIAIDRTKADLESVGKELGCETIAADLANAADCKRAAEQAGRVDLLVNNAGISILQPFLDTTPEAFDAMVAVNVRAGMIIAQVVARGMIQRNGGGAIVNISSQASKVALWEHTSYCATKGAVDQLTRVMALELGKHNIRVNAVNPTVTLTPMAEMAWSDPAKRDPMLAKIPLGRFAKPIDVAHAVAYLLSDQADMITGATLPVDGGFLAT